MTSIKLEIFEVKVVEPLDYCTKWVPVFYGIHPNKRGWKTACIKEIARVTGAAISTVKNWGVEFQDHPDYVKVILSQANIINQMRQVMRQVPDAPIDI